MYNKEQIQQICRMIREQSQNKFEGACIYTISIDNKIVYIGKSTNTINRIAAHIMNIDFPGSESYTGHKYKIIREAKQKGHRISFDVIYRSQQKDPNKINEDIGRQEGILIRKYMPALNYQIPKEEDWHKFTVNKLATQITLDQLLGYSK